MANKSDLNIKPLHDYLLIEPVEQETKTSSGIIIPDTASKEKPQKGTVVASGSGRIDESGKRVAMEVKVGDSVLYKKWGGTDVKLEGKEYLLVKEEDILAIFN